ncbi:glycosyltransferase [Corallococcus interemptor]|uniref:glycosyltransferase n=1 Tax=Corallococcus interemptor TaxID=2316720 RepID=UPI003D036CCF
MKGKCYNRNYNGSSKPCPAFLQVQDTADGLCATCQVKLTALPVVNTSAPKTGSLAKPKTDKPLVATKAPSKTPRVSMPTRSTSESLPSVQRVSARGITRPADLSLTDTSQVEVKGRGRLFGQIASPVSAPQVKVRIGGTKNQYVSVGTEEVALHPAIKAQRENKNSCEAFTQALCQMTGVPRLHIIWFGGAMPEGRMKALETWIRAFNSELQVFVWADSRVRGWEAINKQFTGMKQCTVVDARDALIKSCQAEWTTAYEMEIGLEPRLKGAEAFVASAAASDVLRLVVVHLYGGLYLDMDMPLSTDWEQRDISFPLNDEGFALLKWNTGKPVNAGMAARAGSPAFARIIHGYLEIMKMNLVKLISVEDLELITKTMREGHEKWTSEMPIYGTAKNFTMFRTGPDILNEAVAAVLGSPMTTCTNTHTFSVEGMFYGNELSWLSPRAMWFP